MLERIESIDNINAQVRVMTMEWMTERDDMNDLALWSNACSRNNSIDQSSLELSAYQRPLMCVHTHAEHTRTHTCDAAWCTLCALLDRTHLLLCGAGQWERFDHNWAIGSLNEGKWVYGSCNRLKFHSSSIAIETSLKRNLCRWNTE